jgi:hypothetical protein
LISQQGFNIPITIQVPEGVFSPQRRLAFSAGNKMARLGARQIELAAKIRQSDVDITHGHVGRSVAE